MEKLTRQSLANKAAERWNKQYCSRDEFEATDKELIYRELVALGETPDPDKVNEAIGNDAWTSPPSCSECKEQTDAVIQIGEAPEYYSETAWICEKCLRAAMELITSGCEIRNDTKEPI